MDDVKRVILVALIAVAVEIVIKKVLYCVVKGLIT